MRKNLPADYSGAWHAELSRLALCLDNLETAMTTGTWDDIGSLGQQLDQALFDLQQLSPPTPVAGEDARQIRQAIAQAVELKALAITRQQQIQPLVAALRRAPSSQTP